MKTRELWLVIASLIILNALTFFYFNSRTDLMPKDGETVATIGKGTITRQEWLAELEERYGEETLRELIDQEVVAQLAAKYDVNIPETDVERELRLFQTAYGGSAAGGKEDLARWEKQIKTSLLLEEILSKDVVVSEQEIKSYYEENKDLYNVPAAYHLSHIVVNQEDAANQIIKELEEGSSFSALAREASQDEFTSSKGGDLGFIQIGDDRYPEEYMQAAASLNKGEWSKPIETSSGYVIIQLNESIDERSYSFEEVKGEIKRQIALSQMDAPALAGALWDEAGVDWFYGKQ
ncbi:peptidylprolyl isomerase [Bacillus sp. FJAT-18017]|uniref:peptidyl-prolyl cis-trans isomerase n=1 Tax=Bacillus sp. FJAT-18017 TaxID=1705566 RepID=UPI0006AF989F|nr:peptidyl-prolyl cis-trans isomerase [Bacillus sp. FJAT-18017]ALC88442.1 peptidylprolyl isomerase [Bacillus sp. FJAT-18017]